MKKGYVVLLVIAAIIVGILVVSYSPIALLLGGTIWEATNGSTAEIEIDSYRLCQDAKGKDIIIIKYLLKNEGKEPTTLISEGDFYVYQKGVSLTEYYEELPKECNYDTEDQYRNIKGGVEYCAEIAYELKYPGEDVEVEVDDYGWGIDKKIKVFKLK